MAKPLEKPLPSSSVARLLDLSAAARAVAAPPTQPEQQSPTTRAPESERPLTTLHAPVATTAGTEGTPTIKREVVLTPKADQTLTRLVEAFRKSTGTKLTTSHVVRAILKGVNHCMDQIEREAHEVGRMKLPSNARERELERERFEAVIADAFVAAVRASAAFRSDSKQ